MSLSKELYRFPIYRKKRTHYNDRVGEYPSKISVDDV